jgi:serine/threonine-protein kinase
MEFVDGIDLAVLTRDHRPLEIPEACEYARQTALGLQHAHDAGFVHRDIKPSNVIVAGERHVPQATEPAVVKILDMGLVRAIGLDEVSNDSGEFFSLGSADPGLTRDGTLVGTPDYMAPEQAADSRTVDHRADLYSLGCTLYFLLTGQPPFADGTPTEKVLKHRYDHPAPLQALRPDVPTSVATIVARLMAKVPDDRFATAAAVAEMLAPLCAYPCGTQPVPIRVRRVRRVGGSETPFAADRSTMPFCAPRIGDEPEPR